MQYIQVSVTDRLATVTLNRPKSNALNKAMIMELDEIFKNINQDDNIGGVILTGQRPFFSAGLDLVELYHFNEEEARAFWSLFLKFTRNLIQFKKPLLAAITGHSPAGGCILALTADYRIMAEGEYVIGLNEVPIGIIVPNSIFQLYAFWLGKADATRSFLSGKLFQPEEALKVGLVDEVVKGESILTQSERKMREYMRMEPNTWMETKLSIRQELIASADADQTEILDKMLQQWWSPATRAILSSILEKLHKK